MRCLNQVLPSPCNSRPRAGFSLLELIVAFTILGLMSVVIFSALRVSLNSYSASQERIQEKARNRVLFDQIKRQIGSLFPLRPTRAFLDQEVQGAPMQPLPKSPLARTRTPLFYGTSDQMTFITVAPLMLYENPGLAVVRYGLSQDGKGHYYLGAMETRFLGVESFLSMAETPVGEPLPLIEGISSLDFQYFGYDPQTDTYDWYDHWDAQETLDVPLAVRINFDREYLVAAVNAHSAAASGNRGLQALVGQ